MSRMQTPIRVVVADDSPVMRRLVAEALRSSGQVEVVGEASDGADALDRCRALAPDVLTLDLAMPRTSGLDVLTQLRHDRSNVRVVVVSSFSQSLVEHTLDVLDAGASGVVAKPRVGDDVDAFAADVIRTVLAVADAPAPMPPSGTRHEPSPQPPDITPGRVLVFACSTGGPRALCELLPKIAPGACAGVVVIQHMPEGFTGPLARRLDVACALSVREAADGDQLSGALALVAPAGHHLRFVEGIAQLDSGEPIAGLRPRADLTISDLVGWAGARTVLVVLTGMGSDALEGARAVRAAGGIVLAQSASDCVVYGMPRHVVEHGLADGVGTLAELPELVERSLAEPLPAT
jgi:two-component system, chemotaxis family, protein-glutamate methylesterase/glutaminase